MTESTRLMRLLYYLTQDGGTVTAAQLAAYAGVSERTIKNDMTQIRELTEDYGCVLMSQKGRGYWLEIKDQEQFRALADRLYYRFSNANFTQEYQERANRIARILLVQDDYIKLDEVADRLCLSRSSLKGIMPDVRELLADFCLELVSRPGAGVRVCGEEINRRFCMLELFLDHDFRNIPAIEETEYLACFALENVDIGELRHHFLRVLRESDTRIVDNNTHRLVRYFFLMYNRFLQGHRLIFSEADQRFLKALGEYQTAKKILDTLMEEDTGISVDEAEIFGLELLLLMWNDLNESDEMAARYPYFYQKSRELAEKIFTRIQKRWGVDFFQISGAMECLISAVIPNYTRIYFSFLGYNRTIGKKVENNMMSSSPVGLALALTAASVIREETGLELSRADLFHYTVRFYIASARIHYDYVPRRVLISAQSGIQSCTIIRDKMVKQFGVESFARLDMVNAYEIRRLNQSDYDYLILNFAPYYYRYDLPMIYADTIPDERQMNQIYYQVMLNGYPLRQLQAMLKFEPDFVFLDVPYESRESFLHLLAYKYCSSRDIPAMEAQLLQYTDVCVWNGTAAIILDARLTGNHYFHLYRLENPGVWEKKTIRHVLFAAVNFQGEPRLLKYLEQLTHELVNNPENLERLISTGSMNQFCEIVKHGLTLRQ